MPGLGLGVQGLGFKGLRVQGLGFIRLMMMKMRTVTTARAVIVMTN